MKKSKDIKWSGKSRGGYYGYLFFICLIRFTPIRFSYFFLSLIVPYFILFACKATAAIWSYNRTILHYGFCKSVVKIYHHYYLFGQTIIDKIAINCGKSKHYCFEFENYDEFIAKLDSGKALILIGAHVGCWEIGASFFGEYAPRLNVVMYDAEYQKIKEVVEKTKSEKSYNIIAINRGSLESIIAMKNVVDRADYLCFQGDRYVREESTIRVPFMGHDALFPKGVFEVTAKFRVPVVLYFATRERGMKYRFRFVILEKEAYKTKEELLDFYVKELEQTVTKNPQQWFNFYKFWL